jgi:hypothetical protein
MSLPTPSVKAANATERFAILHRPFAATDLLPTNSTARADVNIVPNSQRLAGTDHGTTFWIAETKAGGACLVAANPNPTNANNFIVCSGEHLAKGALATGMFDSENHGYSLATDDYSAAGANPARKIATNVWAE